MIFYTLDGSDPGLDSLLYEKPFQIRSEGPTTLKARAFKEGLHNSPTASATFYLSAGSAVGDWKITGLVGSLMKGPARPPEISRATRKACRAARLVMSANVWYHVSVNYDYAGSSNSAIRFYLDGSEDGGTGGAVGPVMTNTQSLMLGRYDWMKWNFDG